MKLSSAKQIRNETILTLYYLSGLCSERVARHAKCTPVTVNAVIAKHGPAFKETLGEHHNIPATLRGRRWDHSLITR